MFQALYRAPERYIGAPDSAKVLKYPKVKTKLVETGL